MELPSTRELELEVLLRERESQLTELRDEITLLRQYLSKQAGPSTTEPVTLPPALVAVLLPHINAAASNTATSTSATVAGGLNQRMRQLQEENDELYNLLKTSETGRLKDEARSLRRAVVKLEGALKESHQVISSLSEELEKTHEALMNSSRHKDPVQTDSRSYSRSPRASYHGNSTGKNTNPSKPPPTGPRGYKRPRLSDPQASPPPPRPVAPLPPKPQGHNHHSHSHPHHPPVGPMRSQGSQHGASDNRSQKSNLNSPRPPSNPISPNPSVNNIKMEVDNARTEAERAPSPAINRERERTRERERNNKERERVNREREREREARPSANSSGTSIVGAAANAIPAKPPPGSLAPRRNGNNHNSSGRGTSGGIGGSGGRKANNSGRDSSENRTLQERMGL